MFFNNFEIRSDCRKQHFEIIGSGDVLPYRYFEKANYI